MAEDLQVLGGDPITRVNAQGVLEASPRVVGHAQPREGDAKVRPGWRVSRIQPYRMSKLALREFQSARSKQESPVVESNTRDTRAQINALSNIIFRALASPAFRKSDGQVVDVVGEKVLRTHDRVVDPDRAELLSELRHRHSRAAAEHLKNLVVRSRVLESRRGFGNTTASIGTLSRSATANASALKAAQFPR